MKNLNEFKMVKKNPKDYTIEKFETEFGIMPFPEKSYRQLEKNEITKELKEKRQDYQKCKSFFFEKNNQFHFKMKMATEEYRQSFLNSYTTNGEKIELIERFGFLGGFDKQTLLIVEKLIEFVLEEEDQISLKCLGIVELPGETSVAYHHSVLINDINRLEVKTFKRPSKNKRCENHIKHVFNTHNSPKQYIKLIFDIFCLICFFDMRSDCIYKYMASKEMNNLSMLAHFDIDDIIEA